MSENIANSESPYGIQDYMKAMVEARKDRGAADSRCMEYSIQAHEWLDTLARSLGIQTWRESWWDSDEEKQREKILERIAELRGKVK